MLSLRSLLQPCSSLLLRAWPHVCDDRLLRAGHPHGLPSHLGPNLRMEATTEIALPKVPRTTVLPPPLSRGFCGGGFHSPWAGRGVGVGHSGETREFPFNQWPLWTSGQLAVQVSAPGEPLHCLWGLGPALDLLTLSSLFLSFFSLFFNKRNSDLSKLNKQSNTPLGISKEAPALKVYYENLKMLLEGFPRGSDSKENALGLGLSAGVKSRPAPDGSNLHSSTCCSPWSRFSLLPAQVTNR